MLADVPLPTDLHTIMLSIISGTLVLMLSGIAWIIKLVLKTNGCVGRLQQWAESHEKIDDERHRENKDDHDKVWEVIERRTSKA